MAKVYLAGPISGCSYEGCTSWREFAISRLKKYGLVGISPMRAKEYLLQETTIADQYDTVLSCQKGIVARDRWDTMRCDIIIANFEGATKPSLGTVMEIAWADAHRVPIIVVMEPGNPHDHAMIREVAGFIVPTLDEALTIAGALLSNG